MGHSRYEINLVKQRSECVQWKQKLCPHQILLPNNKAAENPISKPYFLKVPSPLLTAIKLTLSGASKCKQANVRWIHMQRPETEMGNVPDTITLKLRYVRTQNCIWSSSLEQSIFAETYQSTGVLIWVPSEADPKTRIQGQGFSLGWVPRECL